MVFVDPLQDLRRYRKYYTRRSEAALGQHVMYVDEAERGHRGGSDRIEMVRGTTGEGDHALCQRNRVNPT